VRVPPKTQKRYPQKSTGNGPSSGADRDYGTRPAFGACWFRRSRRAEVRQLPVRSAIRFRASSNARSHAIVSGIPFFYVRGRTAGNVGYFLDGIRVPYFVSRRTGSVRSAPRHGRAGRPASGGYPASFGRFAGGIVSVKPRRRAPTAR
jgi:hypothetical protein